jgi:hypothetical protein
MTPGPKETDSLPRPYGLPGRVVLAASMARVINAFFCTIAAIGIYAAATRLPRNRLAALLEVVPFFRTVG